MQILIDIPDEKYDAIKNNYNTFPAEMKEWGLEAIRKGTLLSKYHTDSIVSYVLHRDLGCPLNECVNAYEKAIEYLRSMANMKG